MANFKYQLGCGCNCTIDCSEPCVLLQNGTKEAAFEIIRAHYEQCINQHLTDFNLYVYSNELGYVNNQLDLNINEPSLTKVVTNIDGITTPTANVTLLLENNQDDTNVFFDRPYNEGGFIYGHYYNLETPQSLEEINTYINSLRELMNDKAIVSLVRCKKLNFQAGGYGYKTFVQISNIGSLYAHLKSVDWNIIKNDIQGNLTTNLQPNKITYKIPFTVNSSNSTYAVQIKRPSFCLTTGTYVNSLDSVYSNYSRDSSVGSKTYSGTITKTKNAEVYRSDTEEIITGISFETSVSIPITMTIIDNRDCTESLSSDVVLHCDSEINNSSITHSFASQSNSPVLNDSGCFSVSFNIEQSQYNINYESKYRYNQIIYITNNENSTSYSHRIKTDNIEKDFGVTLPSLEYGKHYFARITITEEEFLQSFYTLYQQFESEYGEYFVCKLELSNRQTWYCILPKNLHYDSIEKKYYLTNINNCNE